MIQTNQEATKPVWDKQDELTDKDLEKASGGIKFF